MAGRLIGVIILPLLIGVTLLGLARLVALRRVEGPARAAQARSIAATGATITLGVVAMIVWAALGGSEVQDRRLATMPLLGATVAVLAAAVTELTWPRPRGTVRTATLGTRSPEGPVRLVRLTWAGLAATVAALAVGAATASPDGRSVTRAVADSSATSSPYPGRVYAVPVAVSAVMLILAVLWALRRVEARPALGPGHEELDRAVRETSRVRVLRPAAAGSLLTSAALWLIIGTMTNSVTQNLRSNTLTAPRWPGDWVQDLGFVATGLGCLLCVATLVALLQGSPPLPSSTGDAPTERAEPA